MTSSILTKYGSNKSSHQYIAVKKQTGERQVLNGVFSIYRGRRLNRFNLSSDFQCKYLSEGLINVN